MAHINSAHTRMPLDAVAGFAGPAGMPERVRDALYRISMGMPMPPGLLGAALGDLRIAHGSRDWLLASMMTGLMARGPVEDEVVELLQAALKMDMRPVPEPAVPGSGSVIVVAGSGKKGMKTFNISTPSAIVAAAAGAAVVKVGSCATSSAMGSRDLARHWGLPESYTAADIRAAVSARGFAFVPVEAMIPCLDEIYGGRFHVVNPFSYGLAVLACPVRADVVVYGLAHPSVDLAARVLRRLGIRDALVVASGSASGYFADEIGMGERSLMCWLRAGHVARPASFETWELPGMGRARQVVPEAPTCREDAVRWAVDALSGQGRDLHVRLIAVNAGMLLAASGHVRDLAEGYDRALSLIRSGHAWAKVRELREAAP